MRRTFVTASHGPDGAGKENLAASMSLPSTTKTRNRLFSSSESESSDSAVEERDDVSVTSVTQPTRAFSMASSGRSVSAKQQGSSSAPFGRNGATGNGNSSNDLRRKTMTSSSSFKGSSGSTSSGGRESANNSFIGVGSFFPERKGLFEHDDDTESMEKFHEQVKIRQQKKQSEMETVKTELESTLQRVTELEQQLVQEVKEKQEYEIRMKECHRIIEKRNKQLMKASERVARYSEQAESQMNDLQAKVTELTAQCDQLRVEASRQSESLQYEAGLKLRSQQQAFEVKLAEQKQAFEAKLVEQKQLFEGRLERMTQISEDSVKAKQSENEALKRRVKELETEVSTAPSRMLQSEEYQVLLKRCEDAEAISRGLKFQLQKDQQEKKFLKNQLSALQISGANGSSGLFGDEEHLGPNGGDQMSPTSSVASGADLSSFDYARTSLFSSPVNNSKSPLHRHTDFVPPTIDTNFESNVKITDEQETVPLQRTPKPKDEPVIVTPRAPPAEEKSPLPRQGSASTNFFEKLSIKFKRSSSPRNSASTKTENNSFSAVSAIPVGAASTSSFTSSSPASPVLEPIPAATATAAPVPVRTTTSRRERPKMYVAKAPSTYDEESSDSIFGSESDDSDDSPSGTEDESPPMPPPPPEETFKPTTTDSPATALPSTQSFLFGPQQVHLPSDDSDDADLSSSSDSDAQLFAPSKKKPPVADELPPPPVAIKKPDGVAKGEDGVDSSSESSSSDGDDSDDEDDSLIDKGPRDHEDSKRKRHRAAAPATEAAEDSDGSSDSSSSSSDEELDTNRHRRRRENEDGGEHRHHHRHHHNHHDSQHHGHHKKESRRSSSLPRTTREKSHSTGDEVTGNLASTSKSRMNEYMEARAKKRQEKLKKKEEKENAESKKKEEYEKEWEKMAQEERERKRKQARRGTRRRPSSLKTVRVSQMKQQLNKQQQQKEHEQQSGGADGGTGGQPDEERPRRQNSRRKSESKVSDSDDDEPLTPAKPVAPAVSESTPLPPEPTEADTELYLRQQARLRERHELEMKKKSEADEADLVRGQIHRRVEMWAFGKELLHMILTLDQISTNEALQKCQMSVIQSPDNETVRKAYRNIIRVIHPDKLRGATVSEQLEAKELFTVLNQAFEKFKNQVS